MAKVITDKVRFSYANVFEPKAMHEGAEPKYSVSLIIPKSNTGLVRKIKAAIDEALEEGKNSKFGGKIPTNFKNPLRDGDAERPDDPSYADSYFVNANSNRQPGLVDKALNPILDRDEFYSGCYGRASVNFYPFSVSGNKGVACGLNNLQKLADGERLSGGASAEDDFAEFADNGTDDLL